MPLASRATQARAARVAATREDAAPVAPRRGREAPEEPAQPDAVEYAVADLGNAVAGEDSTYDGDLGMSEREQVADEEERSTPDTNPGPSDKAEEAPVRRRRSDAGKPRASRVAPSAAPEVDVGELPAIDQLDKRELRAAVTELETKYRDLVRRQEEERNTLKGAILDAHSRLLDL